MALVERSGNKTTAADPRVVWVHGLSQQGMAAGEVAGEGAVEARNSSMRASTSASLSASTGVKGEVTGWAGS